MHPVAIRYHFHGDVEQALSPALDDIERRLSWRPKRELGLVDRITRVGESLLCLKELEYLRPPAGRHDLRAGRAADRPSAGTARTGMAQAAAGNRRPWPGSSNCGSPSFPTWSSARSVREERDRRWKQLADMYLAQQLACYPPDYLRSNPTQERLLETVERFEENLHDTCRVYRPMTATVTIGPPITVNPVRERGTGDDPLMIAPRPGTARPVGDHSGRLERGRTPTEPGVLTNGKENKGEIPMRSSYLQKAGPRDDHPVPSDAHGIGRGGRQHGTLVVAGRFDCIRGLRPGSARSR